MILARIFTKIFKEGGIILIDAKGQKYICGNPKTEKPITVKLLKDNLSWKLLLDPELEFPEAYMRNEIEIENASMKDFLMELIKNLGRNEISTTSLITKKIYQAWRTITNFNLPGKSRKNVEHHYDIGGTRGEKLYDIFLDKTHRLYSCAYWKNDTKTLEEAQQNKINHIIKKLDIKEGQKVLEVGCGWGGMAFEIAKQRKCEVTGISLSKNQIEYCKRKAKELNLDNQVKFELMDYREAKGKYDRIFSVGMFEHVGRKFYNTFFKSMNKLLTDDGIFLLHTIGVVDKPTAPNKFIQKYIFPGGMLPSPTVLRQEVTKAGLRVQHSVEFGKSYSQTLRRGFDVFNDQWDTINDMGFDDRFRRMWNFYLTSCAATFESGNCDVTQITLQKPESN